MVEPALLEAYGVRLIPLRLEHAADLVRAASAGELWSLEVTIVPGASTVQEYIGKALAEQRAGTGLPYAIEAGGPRSIVGSTGFLNLDASNRKTEIGATWIARSWQGTSVNPAIKYLMLRYAFEELKFARVQFQTNEQNAHSRAAILKLGAKEEGIIRNDRIMPSGLMRNSAMYSIIEAEWPVIRDRLERRLA